MGCVREARIEDEDDVVVLTIVLTKRDKGTMREEVEERKRRREREREDEKERREEELEREKQEKQMQFKLKQLSLHKAKGLASETGTGARSEGGSRGGAASLRSLGRRRGNEDADRAEDAARDLPRADDDKKARKPDIRFVFVGVWFARYSRSHT
jgi:hypothetical protein